jgi:hypothetical protein
MHRDAGRERQRRGRVPERVQRPGRDAGRLAVTPEPLGEALRVNRPAELLSQKAREGSTSAMIALERALRARAREEDEVGDAIDRILGDE